MTGRDYRQTWNPTKTGRAEPPPTQLNRIGEPSSAKRRQQDRIYERQVLSGIVQLAPGVLVVHNRKPWRVLEVRERPVELWGERWEQLFEAAVQLWERYPRGERPEKATWYRRPIVVVLVPDGKPNAKPVHLCGPASHDWPVLPEHYAVCRVCGELPPCPEELADQAVERQMARTEELMAIPAGHCLGCGEAITSRMKAVRFPGPNLWRPDLGESSAVFHARAECSDDVRRYREQWLAVGGEPVQPELPVEDAS